MAIFSNLYVPDERDLRFASTGSNYNPRNTQCMDACPLYLSGVVIISAFPPLKVRDLRLELEQKLPFFKGLTTLLAILSRAQEQAHRPAESHRIRVAIQIPDS